MVLTRLLATVLLALGLVTVLSSVYVTPESVAGRLSLDGSFTLMQRVLQALNLARLAGSLYGIACILSGLVLLVRPRVRHDLLVLRWGCVTLLAVSMVMIFLELASSTAGWDFDVYCSAVAAFGAGKNPYMVGDMPFVYLPSSLLFFEVLCAPLDILPARLVYGVWWALFLLAGVYAVCKADMASDKLLLSTVILSGFATVYWSFATGNIAIIEIFVVALVFYGIVRGKYVLSAVSLSFLSMFKIFPLILGLSFVWADRVVRLRSLIALILSFALIVSFNAILFRDEVMAFSSTVIGVLSRPSEHGGLNNPATFFLIKELSERLFDGPFPVLLFYGLLTVLIAILFVFFLMAEDTEGFVRLFSMSVLGLMLIMPRLKPYDFALALVPAYFLIKDLGATQMFISLLLVSVGPAAVRILQMFVAPNEVLGSGMDLLLAYGQTLFLLMFYTYMVGVRVRESGKMPLWCFRGAAHLSDASGRGGDRP